MSRTLSDEGGVPLGRPIGGFLPSFFSPAAGGPRLGPFGTGVVLVLAPVGAGPPAGISLVLLLPPQPAVARTAATSRAAAPRRGRGRMALIGAEPIGCPPRSRAPGRAGPATGPASAWGVRGVADRDADPDPARVEGRDVPCLEAAHWRARANWGRPYRGHRRPHAL